MKICAYCKQEYTSDPRHPTQVYCSHQCCSRAAWHRIPLLRKRRYARRTAAKQKELLNEPAVAALKNLNRTLDIILKKTKAFPRPKIRHASDKELLTGFRIESYDEDD